MIFFDRDFMHFRWWRFRFIFGNVFTSRKRFVVHCSWTAFRQWRKTHFGFENAFILLTKVVEMLQRGATFVAPSLPFFPLPYILSFPLFASWGSQRRRRTREESPQEEQRLRSVREELPRLPESVHIDGCTYHNVWSLPPQLGLCVDSRQPPTNKQWATGDKQKKRGILMYFVIIHFGFPGPRSSR